MAGGNVMETLRRAIADGVEAVPIGRQNHRLIDSRIQWLDDAIDMSELTELRCEYLVNPLGLDVRVPRLSWQMEDSHRGAKQSAYRILIAGSADALNENRGDLWDSGKVDSDQSAHVPYGGPELQSKQQCYWKVRIWNERGEESQWSQPAWWEMGLLKRSEWKGKWIGSQIVGGPRTLAPAPYLRKEFQLNDRPVSARLYVTALGLYEFHINGQRVDKDIFTPGRTEYAKCVQYQVYDVTPLLRSGENAVGAILGDGWYAGHNFTAPRQMYGDRPKLLAQIEIIFADGSRQIIATDGSWKTGAGPILANDLLMGETYDARLEMPRWNAVGFDDREWSPCKTFSDPGIEIVANRCPPVRETGTCHPVRPPWNLYHFWFFDLGQNMVGRVRLKVRGKAGQTVTLRYAEMLNPDGGLYTEALRSAKATDIYTLKGDGEEIYESRFTFHGFRYVEASGLPTDSPPALDTITGVVLHSDIEPIGSFSCSDSQIDRLQHNIVWSQKGNFLEIPTDCPQRDERLGWTGDAQVFVRTAAFNMNVGSFFSKWLRDMRNAQRVDGAIPCVVPHCPGIQEDGGPAWADAAIICPWTIYQCYGDREILRENYSMMVRFMEFLEKNSRNLIRADEHWDWQGYGDWLSTNAETPKDLIGTAFFAHDADLMARIADVLGNKTDAEKYRQLFENIREAFQKRFLTADGLLMGQTQTAYVLALQFNLLPDEVRGKIVDSLVADIRWRDMHLSTGFVGTPYLPHVLSESGHLDIAYALLNQKTPPSWLYPVTQGATTIWERWDGWTKEKGFNDPGMNSFNHYAYGAVGAWMYSTIAGIDLDPNQPGYKHIIFRIRPGGGIWWASASLKSMYGQIESTWRIKNHQLRWEILVPPNTTATVYWPGENPNDVHESGRPISQSEGISSTSPQTFNVLPGQYTFSGPLK